MPDESDDRADVGGHEEHQESFDKWEDDEEFDHWDGEDVERWETGEEFDRAEDEYFEDEYIEDEYVEDEYAEDEYVEDEYFDDEYVEDEYFEDEYAEDEYFEDEYIEDEYVEDEYAEDDYVEDEYIEDEYDEYAEDDYVEDEAEIDSEQPTAKTDGEGYVHDRSDTEEVEPPDPDDDIGGISTPPDDEEMPLADHIEEMVWRLAIVLLLGAAGTAIGLLWASPAIEIIWDQVFPHGSVDQYDTRPHVYHPLELWLTRIKVAALLGVLIALPALVYQTYKFMRPGLYPHERKYYLSAVPVSLVLAAVGMFVSFIIVLPILFRYFTYYAEGSAEIAYALGDTFNMIIVLTAFLAFVFQIPLFIMLAIMMGVTTRAWLADKRLYFWAAFFGISFMFAGVDLTMTAPIIIGIIMIVLFEGTLLILKWVGAE